MTQGPLLGSPQIAIQSQESLGVQAARNLATTTKTVPQMQAITPRWVLSLLPWVQVESGTYRVNRLKVVLHPDARIATLVDGGRVQLEPEALRALALFRTLDAGLIERLAVRLESEYADANAEIVPEGDFGNKFFIIARGKVEVTNIGDNGKPERVALLGAGDYFGELSLGATPAGASSARALTNSAFLTIDRVQLDALLQETPELRQALFRALSERAQLRAAANPSSAVNHQ